MVHLGARAVGGRWSCHCRSQRGFAGRAHHRPPDAGIWSDAHAQAWTPIAAFVKHYAFPGIQIAHAGRKGSANRTPSCATGRPISSLLAELSDPHWPCHAAQVLGLANPERFLPPQYAHCLKSRTRTPD
jgi:2,4-dienoyl-CoA reductase-like NADH-dependent reductase (Old Yellow Enzyme family)